LTLAYPECLRAPPRVLRQHLPREPQDLGGDQEKPDCFRYGEWPICAIRFPSLIEGNFRDLWIAVWRQEREARPVLINPAISNVDWDTEPTGKIAGGTT